MWPGNSKAPVARCVVCEWNSAQSVGERMEPGSRTFQDQVYVVEIKYEGAFADIDEKIKHA